LTGSGYTNAIVEDNPGHSVGLIVQQNTSVGICSWYPNPEDKSVVVAFDHPASTAVLSGPNAALQSKALILAPGTQGEVMLTHYFLAGHDRTGADAIEAVRSLNADADLKKSIAEWHDWFAGVPAAYDLSRIKDPRGRLLMEGALVVLKTNQSRDGGFFAHATYYREGYVRDAAMAVRGLLATGHTEEAKQWLLWCDKKFSIDHHFGDAMSCSVSLDDKSGVGDRGDLRVEEPGWILLCARDYYAKTHDLAFLKSINRTLCYSAEVQLQEAQANGEKLSFNGDETEICTAIDVTSTGSSEHNTDARQWSLSSVAMAIASLDFFIDYLKATDINPTSYRNSLTNTTTNLVEEKGRLIAAMDRDFWRTDVPEIPGGFHDFFRAKTDGSWPKARLVNFTLMPVFFGTDYPRDEKSKDVAAMAQYFDAKSGFLPLVPGAGTGMEGHDLGYLLWDLVEMGDARKDAVYSALVNGKTPDAWGAFSEAYDSQGQPNGHDLRSLETGINVSAIAKYWGLGGSEK
jgi:hypothetical protein